MVPNLFSSGWKPVNIGHQGKTGYTIGVEAWWHVQLAWRWRGKVWEDLRNVFQEDGLMLDNA